MLRFRAPGIPGKQVAFHDLFKGQVIMPENQLDIVLLKTNGLPTYHFAHAVDDLLMHTTHVLRGDEWLSSLPVHQQLFDALDAPMPITGHLAPIMKQEGTSKRKFSKRRDAEGHVVFYIGQGVPAPALGEYYMHLINSPYEDWRRANPNLPFDAYEIDLEKFSVSGTVLDPGKLGHLSKQYIASLSAEEALDAALHWAQTQDPLLYDVLTQDPGYACKVFALGRGGKQPRKDVSKWSDLRDELGYLFDQLFHPESFVLTASERGFLAAYAKTLNLTDKETWFAQMKALALEHGYAPDKKAYQQEPAQYLGTLADAAQILRQALTGRKQSPDLYEILQVLSIDRARKRLEAAAQSKDSPH